MPEAATSPERATSGLQAAIAQGAGRLDRFAGLAERLERAAVACAAALQSSLGGNVQLVPAGLVALRLGALRLDALLASFPPGGLLALAAAEGENARVVLHIDGATIALIVDAAFGGAATPAQTLPRALTKIDIGVARLALEVVLRSVGDTVLEGNGERPVMRHLGDSIEPKAAGRDGLQLLRVAWKLTVGGRDGSIVVGIALPLLEHLTALPQKAAAPAPHSIDSEWGRHFERHVAHSAVALTAVLEERLIPLGEIAALRVGEILDLQATVASRIKIECAGDPLAWGRLGKASNAFALKVDELIDARSDLIAACIGEG